MKKKIHLIPHTHWDKEWYFPDLISDNLFSHNFNLITRLYKNNKLKLKNYLFDGQLSLIDDLLSNQPELRNLVQELVDKKYIYLGAWYSQPDFYNSSAETTFRNILYGKQLISQFNFKTKTIYCPDSFGFNNNLPQIFRSLGFENFIFWRGMKKEDALDNAFFNWVGIDDTKIMSYCYSKGYYPFGAIYPYNNINNHNLDTSAKKFTKDAKPLVDEIFTRLKNNNNECIIPLGGDQAPYVYKAYDLINKVNKFDKNYNWQWSTLDNFFNNKSPNKIITGDLNYPYDSRIHRTIGSSRVDIKKLFRKCENKLYYHLEPLQIYYMQIDANYNPNVTRRRILRIILKSQAHDSLGGCNSDIVNRQIFDRLQNAFIMLQGEIDYIMKKLSNFYKIQNNEILLINTAPFVNNVSTRFFISNKSKKPFNKKLNGIEIIQIAPSVQEQTGTSKYWKHYLELISRKVPPFTHKIVKFSDFKDIPISNVDVEHSIKLKTTDNKITLLFKNKIIIDNILEFIVNNDYGDLYDYSPKRIGEKGKCLNADFVLKEKLNTQTYSQFIFKFVILKDKVKGKLRIKIRHIDEKVYVRLSINNRSKLIKLSTNWSINDFENISFHQHLAIKPYVENPIKDSLKSNYQEYLSSYTMFNELLSIKTTDNYFNIITNSANEFKINHNRLNITLFRSVNYLGKNDLAWRPGRASGITGQMIKTPDGLLRKKLTYNFDISFNKSPEKVYNDYHFAGSAYVNNEFLNPLNSMFDNFILNDIVYKNNINYKCPNLKENYIISAFYYNEGKVYFRYANQSKPQNNLRKYEIVTKVKKVKTSYE